jgi:hypothetical protein
MPSSTREPPADAPTRSARIDIDNVIAKLARRLVPFLVGWIKSPTGD